ncbi:MAG: TetR/AcrR family transcriptional regulator [Saprospiraceae bacterium]|nr:TetR/AcrR family transcriptional regulator [Saprospiraceae bacterium]
MKEHNSTGIQILEAAKVLFAEKGYRGVSTKKIAEAAKVNEVTLFRIFGSKEKLFEETFEHFFFNPNFASLFNLDNLSFGKVLQKFGEVLHSFFVGNISLIKMEIQNQDLVMKKSLNKFPNEIKQILSNQFKQQKGLSDNMAELQAVCYMTALHGLCLNLYIFQSFTAEIKFNDCLDILVEKFR